MLVAPLQHLCIFLTVQPLAIHLLGHLPVSGPSLRICVDLKQIAVIRGGEKVADSPDAPSGDERQSPASETDVGSRIYQSRRDTPDARHNRSIRRWVAVCAQPHESASRPDRTQQADKSKDAAR